jgi:hypothetical protein
MACHWVRGRWSGSGVAAREENEGEEGWWAGVTAAEGEGREEEREGEGDSRDSSSTLTEAYMVGRGEGEE